MICFIIKFNYDFLANVFKINDNKGNDQSNFLRIMNHYPIRWVLFTMSKLSLTYSRVISMDDIKVMFPIILRG